MGVTDQPLRLSVCWLVEDASSAAAAAASPCVAPILQLPLRSAHTESSGWWLMLGAAIPWVDRSSSWKWGWRLGRDGRGAHWSF
jgi:hypothetical protein